MASKPQPGDLEHRLNAITAELVQIREQLGLRAEDSDVSALHAFKNEIDELRRFLWRCVSHAQKAPTQSCAATPTDNSFMDSVYRIVDKAGTV